LLDTADAVSFNGDASTDLAGAPFTLLAPLPAHAHAHARGPATAIASVTTNRKPYELPVAATLLRALLLVPEAFAVASDLSWTQWGQAFQAWLPAVRRFEPGQAVHVHAYGNWRAGIVTKLGRTRVTVRYVRNVGGQLDERPFPATGVHSADGVALVAVDHLRHGDVVIGADGEDLTVETVSPAGRRRRVMRYTDASEVTVPAGTVLRVRA
jgi:hypothetical protein